MTDYTIKFVGGHVEVFDHAGRFIFSADTVQEAYQDLRDIA